MPACDPLVLGVKPLAFVFGVGPTRIHGVDIDRTTCILLLVLGVVVFGVVKFRLAHDAATVTFTSLRIRGVIP